MATYNHAMAAVLEFDKVSKLYRPFFQRHERWALRDFSLQVEPGEIVGFLGRNGAGKTTAIHIALGLLHPTSGHGAMLGQSFGNVLVRRRIGFLSETPAFFPGSARNVVKMCGALNGMREPQLSQRANVLLETMGLLDDANRNIVKFSRGMLQRVGVAQALINDPELLILDEPTSALDPLSRIEVRKALLDARARGRSVFLSSHQLSEVELICDRVVLLHEGRVVTSGRTHELLKSVDEFEIVAEGISMAPSTAKNIVREGTRWRFSVMASQQRAVVEQIWLNGGTLVSVMPKQRSLEELFVDLLQASAEGQTPLPARE